MIRHNHREQRQEVIRREFDFWTDVSTSNAAINFDLSNTSKYEECVRSTHNVHTMVDCQFQVSERELVIGERNERSFSV